MKDLVIKKKKTVVSVYRGRERLITGKDVMRLGGNLIAVLFDSYSEVFEYKNGWLLSVARHSDVIFPFLDRIYRRG